MGRKIVSGIVLALLFISMLTLAFNIQPVKSDWTWTETIYIRADGSVDPVTAPITSADNITYTLTDNIVGIVLWKLSAIMVERNNIVVDGTGYTLQSTATILSGTGINLTGRSNVAIKNTKIKAFGTGISLYSSSNNTISGNSISASYANGIKISSSSNNKFYHNNFLGNAKQVYIDTSTNVWNASYPSGGNYWSNYTGVDVKKGPNQDQDGSDGIGDTPHTINANNKDKLPLMKPFGDVEPPVANAGPDQIVGKGMTVTFDGSKSTDDIAIKSYVWKFTDITPKTLTGMKPTYTFNNVGNFEVTLNVSDYAGNWDTDTVTITVLLPLYIHIRANGSIDPPTAPITNVGNKTYTLTDNIYGKIVVERNNIVVDGAGYTLQGAGNGTGVNLAGRSNVAIKNMKINAFHAGIFLYSSSNNTASGNNMTNNEDGVILEYSSGNTIFGNNMIGNSVGVGVGLGVASNNRIYGNHITRQWRGIMLIVNSNNNDIYGNDITRNNEYGIFLNGCSSNNIYRNNVTKNSKDGIFFDNGSSNNTIYRNNITGNTLDGILLYNFSLNNTISGNSITNNSYGIQLLNSSDNTISENYITAKSGDGITLNDSSGNTISGNDITGNPFAGIIFTESSNNIISGNHITKNNEYGIFLADSSNNKFFHNNLINNTRQIHDLSWDFPDDVPASINTWDNGYPSGGNYWSNYTGVDSNHDGIGDTPHTIDSNNRDRYPLMNPVVYDVAITNVAPQQTVVGRGYPLKVNVTVLNQGNFTQTFDVALYANTTSIASQDVTLTRGTSTTIIFTWNVPTSFAYGNYTISAKAARVPGETDTTDNTYVDGKVVVTITGDINGDGKIDLEDFAAFTGAYGTSTGQPAYKASCDFNQDGIIDLTDYAIFSGKYGQHI